MLSKCFSLSQMTSGHLQKYREVFYVAGRSALCRLSDVQSCKVELYGTHRAENCCYQRYKILLPWVPGGEAGEVGGARVTRQQPAVFSFHGKRLNRRWLVKFEQRTGK